jgi:hypothetical protein
VSVHVLTYARYSFTVHAKHDVRGDMDVAGHIYTVYISMLLIDDGIDARA